jgi:hypothetical protein
MSGVIALAVAAIQVLPSIEYFSRTYRWVGLDVPVSGLRRVPYESYKKYALDWGISRECGTRLERAGTAPAFS